MNIFCRLGLHEWYGYGTKFYGRYDRFCHNCDIEQYQEVKRDQFGGVVRGKRGVLVYEWFDYQPNERNRLIAKANAELQIGIDAYNFKKQLQQDMLSDDACEELLP